MLNVPPLGNKQQSKRSLQKPALVFLPKPGRPGGTAAERRLRGLYWFHWSAHLSLKSQRHKVLREKLCFTQRLRGQHTLDFEQPQRHHEESIFHIYVDTLQGW